MLNNYSKKGSVTIYIALIMISVILVIFVLGEGARINVVHSKSKSFTYMAADSVKASYARELYENYGILAVWDKNNPKDIAQSYIEGNIRRSDIEKSGTNFMATTLEECNVKPLEYITDNGGDYFSRQILEYIKYAVPAKIIDDMAKKKVEVSDKKPSTKIKDIDLDDEEIESLEDDIDNINLALENIENLDELANLKEKYEKALADNKNKKLKKYVSKICKEISEEKEILEKTQRLINKYQIKRALVAKKYNIDDKKDNMDQRLDRIILLLKEEEELEKINELENKTIKEYSRVNIILDDYISFIKESTSSGKKKQAKKEKSLFKKAKELLNNGVLSLVLKNPGKVSGNSVDLNNVPSCNIKKSNVGFLKNQKNKLSVICYDNLKFGNFLDENNKDCLKYGMEYILAGKDTDKENLVSTVERMVAIRNVQTFVYLLTDKSKQSQIEVIADAIAVATELPFLKPIVEIVLNEAWALAEAIVDIRGLLEGKKIGFTKNKENWNTDLNSLGGEFKSEENGITYLTFLNALLAIASSEKTIYRTMDLIDLNIRKNYQPEFRLSQCFQKIRIDAKFSSAPIFVAAPFIVDNLDDVDAYKYNVKVEAGYL